MSQRENFNWKKFMEKKQKWSLRGEGELEGEKEEVFRSLTRRRLKFEMGRRKLGFSRTRVNCKFMLI